MAQNQKSDHFGDKKFDTQAKAALHSSDIFKYHVGTLQSQLPGTDLSFYERHSDSWHGIFRFIAELCSIDHKQSIDYDVSLLRVTERTIAVLAQSLRLGPQYALHYGSLNGHREYESFEGDLIAHPDFRTLEARIPYLLPNIFPSKLETLSLKLAFFTS